MRLARRPHNVRFAELVQLLEAYGFQFRRQEGSHHTYRRGAVILPIPVHGTRVKAICVQRALKATEGEDEAPTQNEKGRQP